MVAAKKSLSTKNGGVKLFFEDEASFGRVQDLKYCWCDKNTRPIIHNHRVRENVEVFGAVEPATGKFVYSIEQKPKTAKQKRGRKKQGERKKRIVRKARKGAKSRQFNAFMKKLSNIFPHDQIILACDNATWHKSQYIKTPKNISLVYLPAYTPEMNPIEQVWREIRTSGFANKYFKTIDAVVDNLQATIKDIEAQTFRSITYRKWIQDMELLKCV